MYSMTDAIQLAIEDHKATSAISEFLDWPFIEALMAAKTLLSRPEVLELVKADAAARLAIHEPS